MARSNTLDLEILGSVACQLKNFSGQVFEYSSEVDGRFGTDARFLACDGSKVTLYATARELLSSHNVSALFCEPCEGSGAGSGDAFRGDAHLKTGFGGVRLGCFDLGVTLSTCLASRLSCTRC